MKLNRPRPAPWVSAWPGADWLPRLRWSSSVHTAVGVLSVWGLSHFGVPRLGWAEVELYVLQPLLWLALVAWVLWRWRRETPPAAFPHSSGLLVTAALLGAVQVAVAVLLGLALGFGHSLLARQWPLVALNLWFAGTRLAGFEFARWYFVRGLSPRRPWLSLVAAWPLFALLAPAPALFSQLESFGGGLAFVGRDLLPTLAESLLATYLSLLGGPLPALLYRGLPVVFEWVAPVLPRLPWLATAFAGTMLPLLGLVLLHDHYLPGAPAASESELENAPPARQASLAAWAFVALMAVGILWFNTGLFGLKPSLVSGYSMQPALLVGDLVISQVVPLETLQVGDIVRFQLGRIDVVHRIQAVTTSADGQRLFITRGDNNSADDPPVTAQQIRGKIVATLPKLGWPAVWLRMLLAQGMALAAGGTP